jgi:hypothetical protein
MSIHTIGDSHSSNGWHGVINHHLGPVLCYSFGKEKLNRCDIRGFNINPLTFSTFLQNSNILHFLKYLRPHLVQYLISAYNNCKNINPEIRGLNR